MDIKKHLVDNTCTFKENLKMLTNIIIDQLYKEKTEKDSIKRLVFHNCYEKGAKIDEIDESESENDSS